MIKKAIVAIVVIVAAAAIVFAALPPSQNNSTNNSNPANNSSSEIQQNMTNNTTSADNVTTSTTTESNTISASDAKEIAGKYIKQPGAYAGSPTLTKIDGNLVYIVPVIYNGENVGEIDINAQTGENVGGAGGAP